MKVIDRINLSHIDMDHKKYMTNMHLKLCKWYYRLQYSKNEEEVLPESEMKSLTHLESAWISYEKFECLNQFDCYREFNTIESAYSCIFTHAIYHHFFLNYLNYEASVHEWETFVNNFLIFNQGFVDCMMMSTIGRSDTLKKKMMSFIINDVKQCKMIPFYLYWSVKDILTSPHYGVEEMNGTQMSWEGLMGMNLMSYLSIHPFNKMKALGWITATYLLDKVITEKLLIGFNRVNANKKSLRQPFQYVYMANKRATKWVESVIIPELKLNPYHLNEVWQGFYMRLNTTERFYDYWLNCVPIEVKKINVG